MRGHSEPGARQWGEVIALARMEASVAEARSAAARVEAAADRAERAEQATETMLREMRRRSARLAGFPRVEP